MLNLFLSFILLLSHDTQMLIEKVWYNTDRSAKIQIYKNGSAYEGKIVWLKEPKDANGANKVDKHNPDERLRNKPVNGLVILRGLKLETSGKFTGGTIYDPKNGKTYSCKMNLIDPTNLEVRGFIGISLLGRTEHWTASN